MNLLGTVQEVMRDLVSVAQMGDAALVATTCLYPDNGLVSVAVRGGPTSFQVSDEGQALREMLNAYPEADTGEAALRKAVRGTGLQLVANSIRSPFVSREALPVAILLVANASKEATEWFYEHTRIKRKRDFRQLVRQVLEKTFPGQKPKQESIVGDSNKAHKFDSVIHLPRGRRLIIDAVTHDTNAINSSVVAHLDVKKRGDPDSEQRIIYDDEDDWSPADLNLLSVGAPVIPYSRSEEVFRRFLH